MLEGMLASWFEVRLSPCRLVRPPMLSGMLSHNLQACEILNTLWYACELVGVEIEILQACEVSYAVRYACKRVR
eukprot:3022-Hanusia_phi.AAC.1